MYHPKCKMLKIVSLCFADDLLVFTNGKSDGVDEDKDDIVHDNVLRGFFTSQIYGCSITFGKTSKG
ncbi:hypothetical protein LINPERPRIM_LOCUS12924 [Linum perenne]